MSSITNDASATASPMAPEVVKPTPQSLITSFLAFISKFTKPNLSLASKSFNSLLSSSGRYNPRSHLETTKTFIYICLWFPPHESPRWFSISMNPNRASIGCKNIEKSRNNLLVPIPCSQSFPISKSTVSVGSEIYILGGATIDVPSSAVRVLDCHSHTWRDAPSMKVARKDAVAGVLNEKIFVFGGCNVNESTYWGEVFDTTTQTWEILPSPPSEVRRALIKKMVVFEGKFYVNVTRSVSYVYAYDPEEGTWECCGGEHNHWMINKTCCVVQNVLYCYGSFGINWYNIKSGKWRNLKGLEGLQSKFHNSKGLRVRVMFEANSSGKLVTFWDEVEIPRPSRTRNRNIWCAEIALERHHEGEICGKLEWIDSVLTVPNSYEFMRCLAISGR